MMEYIISLSIRVVGFWVIWQFIMWIVDEIAIWKMNRGKK